MIDGSDCGFPGATMLLIRPLMAWIAALAVGVVVTAISAEAQPGATAMTCTNPASGASWVISIDYDNHTVDANPAQISAAQISWHDARDGGNYTLDRASGELTVVLASSTGGYFLHDRCRLGSSG
jgi:hypothetical protein